MLHMLHMLANKAQANLKTIQNLIMLGLKATYQRSWRIKPLLQSRVKLKKSLIAMPSQPIKTRFRLSLSFV